MAVKLIASDLDGTLLTNKKDLSPRTREALDLAAAQGIYLVPATGRSFESVPEMIREYPGVEYLITANGGAVYSVSEKKRVYQCLMTPESVDAAIAVRKEKKWSWRSSSTVFPTQRKRMSEIPSAIWRQSTGQDISRQRGLL